MLIYGTLNITNHKMYIGKSVKDDIISAHSRPVRHLNGKGSKLVYQDVQKYGVENFMIIILHKENCSKKKLSKLEKYYINHFNTKYPNGYNLTTGGNGNGSVRSEESKQKSSASVKKAWSDPEFKKKMIEILKIALNKPDVIEKQSKSQLIAQNRIETKKKISETWANKSEEELLIIKKKQSDAHKGKTYANHIRHHFNKGIINVDCLDCIEQVMKEHS